jgi:uncharacterized repeat protein (TIGR03803 family)
VFEIARTAAGYASTPTTLIKVNSYNGLQPNAGPIADANGDLFGTTNNGGANGIGPNGSNGTVFEIAKTATGYASTPTTLVSFNGTDGANPDGSLIADANGDLFGTTGLVFEIAKTATGYASTPITLVSFNGTNGAAPFSNLIADANGDLFGTTVGGSNGDGTVFEIAKTATGYASTPTTLVSFNGTDGATVFGGLIADNRGDLFGTTYTGGAFDDGTVFEIAKTATGYASTPITLVSFNGSNGANPEGSLIADANGDLFSTTLNGGSNGGHGTVFEITDSGFVALAINRATITANGSSYDTITLGNGADDTVSANSSKHDKITLGDGADDTVSANGSSHETITLGNGARDSVSANGSSHDRITLGDGADDTVSAYGSYDAITLGNGAGDTVAADGSSYDAITLGDGAGDSVSANSSNHDKITLGDGAGDSVSANSSNHDKITLGDGADDSVSAYGSYDTITLGNGAGDSVTANSSSYDTITLGNGDGDTVNAN